MKLIKLTSQTPGTRHTINITKNLLAKKNNLIKQLIFRFHNFKGRSSQTGHITVWHRGGGCKKLFRYIKFDNLTTKSLILMINYDPYRNAFISLGFDFIIKKFFFFLTTQTTFPGSLVLCQNNFSELHFGNRTLLKNLPVGVLIHNISTLNSKIAKYSRSAGTFSQILQKKNNSVIIRVSSGKTLTLDNNLFASFGRVSNLKHNLIVSGKAGKSRHKGIRPTVRGVAMNPVDHPHGGRTKGGRPSVSPWGILTKGKPTVKKYE